MRLAFAGALISSFLSTAGCVGPPALHSSVLGYDETVTSLEQESLLDASKNGARVRVW